MNYWAIPGILKCKSISLEWILEAVCLYMNVPKKAVMGRKKDRECVDARQIYCYIARKKTSKSLQRIGETIGKDHSTVLCSIRIIEDRLFTNDKSVNKKVIEQIEKIINDRVE